MRFVDSFQLTLTSLLVVNLLPFLYFGYHSKYWWNYAKIRRYNFFLSAAALILASLVIVKMIRLRDHLDILMFQMSFLHLIPLVLTLLIVKRPPTVVTGNTEPDHENPSDDTGYSPRPLNQEIAKLSWDNLIVDQNLKQELLAVISLLQDPKTSQKYGIQAPKGILLTGPPGTGKTTIAKVIANTAGLNFFNLSSDEIVSKWVGESERNLTKLFNAARRHAPAVIFIDEVDSIGRGRSTGGAAYSENLLNHLLQLMDGVVDTYGLYIIAATNRADLVDDALKRPGRLNKVIEVPLPDYYARAALFELYMSKLSLADNIDLEHLAHATEGSSAADIAAICNQAGLNAFKRESIEGGGKRRQYLVTSHDIELAFNDFAK